MEIVSNFAKCMFSFAKLEFINAWANNSAALSFSIIIPYFYTTFRKFIIMQLKVLIHHLKDLHCTQGWEFAHLAQIKLATVSDLLRSLTTNEPLWANSSGHLRQMSNRERIAHDKWANEWFAQKCWLNNLKSYFLVCFYRFFYLKKLAIGSSPHFWWAMWANCSGHSPKMSGVS